VLAQRGGDIEDGIAADVLVEGEGEDGEFITTGEQPERTKLADLAY
jgi:hypothetical protein